MITVIRDNTKETYYTICDNCGSELEYCYDDVEFETAYYLMRSKTITCPCCSEKTNVLLKTKAEYKEPSIPMYPLPPLYDSCCCDSSKT